MSPSSPSTSLQHWHISVQRFWDFQLLISVTFHLSKLPGHWSPPAPYSRQTGSSGNWTPTSPEQLSTNDWDELVNIYLVPSSLKWSNSEACSMLFQKFPINTVPSCLQWYLAWDTPFIAVFLLPLVLTGMTSPINCLHSTALLGSSSGGTPLEKQIYNHWLQSDSPLSFLKHLYEALVFLGYRSHSLI